MNSIVLIGRLTRDPEIRYTDSQMAIGRFSVAIDRMSKPGEEKKTDFPNVVVFGKQAENCERFLAKGRLVGVQGRLQTGSYKTQSGETRYTTEVVADRVEFLEWGDKGGGGMSGGMGSSRSEDREDMIPEGFEALTDDDMPF